jgi:hypothetical protein
LEYSSFFNSENGDRKYKAEDWDRHLKDLIGNGVFLQDSNNLQVTADGSGMSVVVQPGSAWINGKHYLNDQEITLSIDVADGALDRIDRIIVQCSTADRTITTKIKKGTPASTATTPILQRDADVYELSLATISIKAGAIAIRQENVTDTRLDTAVCGTVTGLVKQVGTDTLYAQIQDDLKHFKSDDEADFTAWSTEQKTEFNAWLQSIKNTLGDDAAGHLQGEIDVLKTTTNDLESKKMDASQKGIASGVASLDSTGKIPKDQLPTTGGYVRQATAPSDTSLLWMDSANGDIMKYYNGTAWAPQPSVWG